MQNSDLKISWQLSRICLGSLILTIGCASKHQTNGSANANIDSKKYAPPPLDANTARRIGRMVELTPPSSGLLSPDGKTLFFTWRVTGTNQVWKLKSPLSFPEQLTGGRDSTNLVQLSRDGRWLILSRDTNGEENPGLYLQSAGGGELIPIFHRTKVQASFNRTSEDGRYLYFSANAKTPESFAIFEYDMQKRTVRDFFQQPGLWQVADIKEGVFLLAKLTGSRSSEYYLYWPKENKLKPLIGHDGPEEYNVAFAPQKNSYFVLTPKLGEFRRLYLYTNEKLQAISPEMKMDVSEFQLDSLRKRLSYHVNDGGRTRFFAMNAQTLRPVPTPQFPAAEHVRLISTTDSGRFSTFALVHSKSPRTNYSFDWQKGKLSLWTFPSLPEIEPSALSEATLEFYESRDHVKIPMFVRRPQKCQRQACPVVVHFHGGPEAQTLSGFSSFAQSYIEEGFVFVEPNVRGSEGYGKSWLNADNGAKRLNVITDIEDCVLYIRKNWPGGKDTKIGVIGWSYGGYSTLMAMSRFAGSYDAGVALVGISNFLTFLNNTAPYRRILRITEYGDPVKDKEALIALSPVTYADRVSAPLMIIQGANDPRVPLSEAIQFHETLNAKKIPSELIVFQDEGHGAEKKDNRILELGHALRFLKQNLIPAN